MTQLVIQLDREAMHDPCALCGQRPLPASGPQLFLADTLDVVCRD